MGESVEVKACRFCLIMDCNLLSIDVQMENIMKSILGQNISYDSGLPKYACDECAQFLGRIKTFHNKCLKAQTVLCNIIKNSSKITDSEIRKLNRTRLKLDVPLSPRYSQEEDEPFQMEIPCVTVKLEPVETMEMSTGLEIETEAQFEGDDEVLEEASNPLESNSEPDRKRPRRLKKDIKLEIKLEPELDISEEFPMSVPTIENVITKAESPDDEGLPYHCMDCCQGLTNEDSTHICPSINPMIQSDKQSGKVVNHRYQQYRRKENARKKKFLENLTPEQKAMKKKKDLEWYHRCKGKKLAALSEEEKAKRRESWKKSSQRYRQRKKERKMKAQDKDVAHK
ncbi:uncharacterized protein LOC128675968 isoform X2 [Plodia interpunctella]|uniref:uncharacterized protein LOC128675968 isoform X2 n=1 Tax=Plodia interpunctella TaxID=58824 RepID=UPI002368B8E9|nr:uncharacterized protein LOC128675968 isoform X2 [Plodia interpunctella]